MSKKLYSLKDTSIYSFICLIFAGFLLSGGTVHAKKTIEDAGAALESAVGPTGLPKNEIATYIGSVAQWIFGILGLLFFVLTLYAGITWFLARGEEEKIAKSRQTLIAAIIGLIITVSGYAIAAFVTNAINFG